MYKVKVVLELLVDEDELLVDQQDLPGRIRYLCGDAFAEFQYPRRSAKKYVAKRYPEGEGYEWLDRDKKALEVEHRVRLARLLHGASLNSVIEVESCCPDCGSTETDRKSVCSSCDARRNANVP